MTFEETLAYFLDMCDELGLRPLVSKVYKNGHFYDIECSIRVLLENGLQFVFYLREGKDVWKIETAEYIYSKMTNAQKANAEGWWDEVLWERGGCE